jgi:glycerate 2-kinase
MDPQRLLTTTLRQSTHGHAIASVMAAALEAVDPEPAMRRFLSREANILELDGRRYDLDQFERIWVVGAGKAAYPMAKAAVDILAPLVSGGLIIAKEGHLPPATSLPGAVRLRQAAHPLPDVNGLEAAQEMAILLRDCGPKDLVLCLISGGGSALMPAPTEGISLQDLQTVTSSLLACGAEIQEINAIRKHLDRLKGGGLARLAYPATLLTLVLSDVIGDPLDAIASGPTVPDPTTFADALAILDRYHLWETLPAPVRAHLEAGAVGELPETPKAGEACFGQVQNVIISSNAQAAHAALRQARQLGWNTCLLTTSLQGEARQAGRFLASIARQVQASGDPLPRPACILAGGETTVTLAPRGAGASLGGRNQELALSALPELAGLKNAYLVSLATDGNDGPTNAAGAVVSGESAARAAALGLDPRTYLARNDSYHFFDPLGDLLLPGPTQTNVNDLAFLFLL